MITITADWTPFARYLNDAALKQLPYATALATTSLAQRAQLEIRRHLGERFTVRSTWISRGVRITQANKRDWPAVQAVVGSIDWFMEAQETGRMRTPPPGRTVLPVPGKGTRPTKDTVIRKSKWPKALLRKGGKRKAFLRKLTSGGHAGKIAVLRRNTNDRYPLEVLYVFERRTEGKARLHMQSDVTRVVASSHELVFRLAMSRALTPKRGY